MASERAESYKKIQSASTMKAKSSDPEMNNLD